MFLWQLPEDWLSLDYKGLVLGRCQVWNLCFRYRYVPIAVLPKSLVSYRYVSFWNHIYGRNVRACWYSSSGLLPLGFAKGDRVRGVVYNSCSNCFSRFSIPLFLEQKYVTVCTILWHDWTKFEKSSCLSILFNREKNVSGGIWYRWNWWDLTPPSCGHLPYILLNKTPRKATGHGRGGG